jgi:trk system potassium uptake protein TrkH
MLSLQPLLLVNGLLLCILGGSMMLPALLDLYYHNPDWQVFAISSFLTLFVGGILYLSNRGHQGTFTRRHVFLVTVSTWLFIPFFAAIPLWLSSLQPRYVDAFFEVTSALSTTGSTTLTGMDAFPEGVILWRGLVQAFGGLGIIVMALGILPAMQTGGGGMQFFRAEGVDMHEKILPRAKEIVRGIGLAYWLILGLCALLLWIAGMSELDAVTYAMAILSTGGLSNHDAGIAFFGDNRQIEATMSAFMLLSGLPMICLYKLMTLNLRSVWRVSQVRWYSYNLLLACSIVTLWLWGTQGFTPLLALHYAVFNVSSLVSTSGYGLGDYTQWGHFGIIIMFGLSFGFSCTGSSTGGFKIHRVQLVLEYLRNQLNTVIEPRGVHVMRYGGKPLPREELDDALVFLILYFISFIVLALALSATGLHYLASLSAAAAALINVGPGLSTLAIPGGNYASFPDAAKWLIAIGMIIGRLELLSVMVLLTPRFWKL